MKRYDFSVAGCMGDSEFGCSAMMDDGPDGDYVLYSDYIAERDRCVAENKGLKYLLEISRNEALELRKHRKPLRDLAAADAIIEELLAMLRPKGEPMKYMLGDQKVDHRPEARIYARACEIAGRTEP